MQVAAIQFEAETDVDANVEKATARIREAAARGAELVVLPEIWNVGYFAFDRYEEYAEPVDGKTMSHLSELAAELKIYLHTGSIVERRDDDLYNMSGLFDPAGELLGTYRKVHLFGYESEENRVLTPGEEVSSIETDFGSVGLATCYDLRFPAQFRQLSDEGIDLLLVTAAWPRARLGHWQLLNCTRALESQVYIVSANLTGENRGVTLAGQSVVVDPWGTPLANAGVNERIAQTEIELNDLVAVRERFPVLRDRRLNLEYSL